MIQHTLNDCELYKLLEKRNGNVAKSLSGTLISSEAEVAKTLEYIKTRLLRIEDCGIGMNKSELSTYLFKTANSGYKYMKQREFIFPAIAKFGIGFVACLTKANKIQISTQTRNHNGIGAEIESESTMAFVEKSVQRDCQGTTIVLQIKENYSFFELRNYIFKYFNYPSVEIDLVNIDEMCTYIDKKDTFDKNISILQFVVHAGKKRKEKLDKTSFDYGFLQKMSNILLDDEDINNLINRIYGILDNVYIETEVTKRVRSVVNKMDEKEEIIRKVRKEVGKQKNIIDKKRKRYPEFLFQRHRSVIPEIVDYKQLILEFDDNFTIKEFYKDKQINVSSRGIIFIPTTFIDYNLGIEWRSVNAFMFNKGKVVKNIIKMSSDLSGILEYRNDIISLDYIADAQYALLFDGYENEKERIFKEGNKLNPVFVRRLKDTIKIYTGIFKLMCMEKQKKVSSFRARRVDRKNSLNAYEKGCTQSFVSCSKGGYGTQFANKNQVILLEVEVSGESPYIDFQQKLTEDEYIYYNEQEILFPPFLPLKIEELALTKGEKKMIKDMHNNPPVGKYLIQPGSFPDYREIIKSSKEELYQRILQGKEEASLCLERMNAGDWCSDYRSYENWKKDFQDYLKLLYSDLWYENGDIKED